MKYFMIIVLLSCFVLFMGCGSEKSDPGDSKTGEQTTAPDGDHQYKRTLDRAKDLNNSAQERNKRLSEEAEK